MTIEVASLEEIASAIVKSGSVSIRDIDSGEEPFCYATGNRGPGYIMVKGLVGQRKVLKFLSRQLAHKVAPLYGKGFDFIEGNATGGMIPAWQLTDDVEKVLGLEEGKIPYTYLRGARKEGGHGELVTGDANNPLIKKGMKVLIVEELVNYAGTTTNAAEEYRKAGYPVSHGACILFYDNPQANALLKEKEIIQIPLITLPQLLEVSEQTQLLPVKGINQYREFLADPVKWQLSRKLVVPGGLNRGDPRDSAKTAIDRGYKMRELKNDEAISLGAPPGKVKEGVIYWREDGR